MGVAFAIQYYIPHPVSEEAITNVSKWMQIISGFALALGLASIFHVHAVKIKRQVPGWGYSIVLYAAMLATLIVGFWSKGETKPMAHRPPWAGSMTTRWCRYRAPCSPS